MNILLITQLYPLKKNTSYSFALHYFVKEWSKYHHVQVIRPYLPYEKENPPENSNIELDNITINVVKPLWIPLIKKSIINKNQILKLISVKPDVIICHLYNSYLTFSFLKKYFKVPFIIGIHRSDVLLAKNYFQRIRIKNSIDNSDMVVYRSFAIKNNFEKYIKPKIRTFIAYSGLSDTLINLAKEELLGNIKAFGKEKSIISVCRLVKLKQIDKVIVSLKLLKDQGYMWKYTIVGDGPEKGKLEKLVKKYQLEGQVEFLGKLPREKVFPLMKSNDIFIMPSYNETFGMAFLEAMANGCIIIGAEGWGIDGVVKDGVNGFLCDPYDQKNIFNVIKDVLDTESHVLERIVESSLKTVINFRIEDKAKEYINIICKK